MTPILAIVIALAALTVAVVAMIFPQRVQPRLTPGIRAEVSLFLGDDGQVSIWHSKIPPEEHASMVYGALLDRWLDKLGEIGVVLDFTTYDGQRLPLVRKLPTDSVALVPEASDDAV